MSTFELDGGAGADGVARLGVGDCGVTDLGVLDGAVLSIGVRRPIGSICSAGIGLAEENSRAAKAMDRTARVRRLIALVPWVGFSRPTIAVRGMDNSELVEF